MTLPDERYRALKYTQEFLRDLAVPSRSARVPKEVRQRALGLLRHYPSTWELDQLAQESPHILQQHMEPLYRMIKVHEQESGDRD